MMSGEVLDGPRCRVGLAPTVSSGGRLLSEGSGGQGDLGSRGAAGGDGGVPGLAGGDYGVQVSQEGRGNRGLGLGRGELVVLAAGQVSVPGGVDGAWLRHVSAFAAPSGQHFQDDITWLDVICSRTCAAPRNLHR